jgi:hypothetical protein
MSNDSVIWKLLTLLVGVLTVVGPAYVAYDLYDRGSAPAKRVQLQQVQPINPLRDLSALGNKATLSLNVEDQHINNLLIAQSFISNTGRSPVLPTDYYEPLRVTVPFPWMIVAVENNNSLLVQLHWHRVSDTVFEAEPSLLNSGDNVSTIIYLTNTQFDPHSTRKDESSPQIKWSAHIINLREFEKGPDIMDIARKRYFGVMIQLGGWSLPFTIVTALLFQMLYLRLLHLAGLPCMGNWYSIAAILCSSLISFAAAESSATYLFGSSLTDIWGVNHWLNAPPILLHVLALTFLYRKSRRALTQ